MNILSATSGSSIILVALLLSTAARAGEDDSKVDAMSGASPAGPAIDNSKELPVFQIPDIPPAAEAYYAPDDFHLIAQVRDPDAYRPEGSKTNGPLTYIFTEDGKTFRRINNRGQDACSWWFPDQKRVLWTSTRDRMDMPLGDWSKPENYPQGAELYTSDLYGNDVRRRVVRGRGVHFTGWQMDHIRPGGEGQRRYLAHAPRRQRSAAGHLHR